MGWIYLLLAGVLEIAWAFGLQLSEGLTRPLLSTVTMILIVMCFFLFAASLKTIPIGTAYAIFTGIGTAGTSTISMLFLQEPANLLKIFFLLMLVTGIIGLKLTTVEEDLKKTKGDA
ncbi:DMT family transporter [Halalkalibacterium ligniniphilum]|uniref:DMT family transporter n=1 Tax=Halalkalibacterium ligniniphilum TaxID=1134413 RepID=UPI000348D599|nr:multidrug efflux SMR transporter [Halalkalibacterium ligniniphilum]